MSWFVIIALIIIGLILVILEILVVPGVIVGLIGGSLIILGIYESFAEYGTNAGYFTIIGTIIMSVIAIIFVFRSKSWNKLMLNTEVTGKMNVIEENKVKAGDRGRAISKLAVGGKALFNGEYYEVYSTGDYIDAGSEIEIVKFDSNRILVKKI